MPLEQCLAHSEHLAVIIILTYLRVIISFLVYQNHSGQQVIDGLLRGLYKMHPVGIFTTYLL